MVDRMIEPTQETHWDISFLSGLDLEETFEQMADQRVEKRIPLNGRMGYIRPYRDSDGNVQVKTGYLC